MHSPVDLHNNLAQAHPKALITDGLIKSFVLVDPGGYMAKSSHYKKRGSRVRPYVVTMGLMDSTSREKTWRLHQYDDSSEVRLRQDAPSLTASANQIISGSAGPLLQGDKLDRFMRERLRGCAVLDAEGAQELNAAYAGRASLSKLVELAKSLVDTNAAGVVRLR